jgi:Flp pilus assembly protein TadG
MAASRVPRWASRPHRPRHARGAAAVEFALVVPILVMLLLGIVTAGLTYSQGISLSNAVREGARFGATADPGTPANWTNWSSDVVARVRTTQIDDSSSTTAICVRLWKGTAAGGAAVLNSTRCDQGAYPSPALAVSDTAFPPVPSGVTASTCVVQILAARKYSIVLGVLPSLSGTMNRAAVERYERATC